MTAKESVDLLLVGAAAPEIRPLATRLGVRERARTPVVVDLDGGRLALLAAGIGRPGDRVLERVLEELQPATVLNVGFAGALDSELPTGTVVLIESWRSLSEESEPGVVSDPALRRRLAEALDSASVDWIEAPAVTVDSPVHDRTKRDRLRRQTGARIVEMEGASWARLTGHQGCHYGAIRVVSDHADFTLPGGVPGEYNRDRLLRPDGTPRWGRWLASAMRSGEWRQLPHSWRRLRIAGRGWAAAWTSLELASNALLRYLPTNIRDLHEEDRL